MRRPANLALLVARFIFFAYRLWVSHVHWRNWNLASRLHRICYLCSGTIAIMRLKINVAKTGQRRPIRRYDSGPLLLSRHIFVRTFALYEHLAWSSAHLLFLGWPGNLFELGFIRFVVCFNLAQNCFILVRLQIDVVGEVRYLLLNLHLILKIIIKLLLITFVGFLLSLQKHVLVCNIFCICCFFNLKLFIETLNFVLYLFDFNIC